MSNSLSPEQWAETITDRCRYSKSLSDSMGVIASAIRSACEEAAADRDYEWWKALALNDAVAPTPEAVKKYILDLQELAAEEAVRAERERCIKIAARHRVEWMYEHREAAREIIQEIQSECEPEVIHNSNARDTTDSYR